MSKSLGNFFTIREVTARYAPDRAPVDAPGDALQGPDQLHPEGPGGGERPAVLPVPDARRRRRCVRGGGETGGRERACSFWPTGIAAEGIALAAETADAVRAALADDLNTPLAIASLSAPLKTLNDLVSTKKGGPSGGTRRCEEVARRGGGLPGRRRPSPGSRRAACWRSFASWPARRAWAHGGGRGRGDRGAGGGSGGEGFRGERPAEGRHARQGRRAHGRREGRVEARARRGRSVSVSFRGEGGSVGGWRRDARSAHLTRELISLPRDHLFVGCTPSL